MNLFMIIRKKETKSLLLSILKIVKRLWTNSHKTTGNNNLNLQNRRETSSFKPLINLGATSNWMVGLTSLEVYIFTFKITG